MVGPGQAVEQAACPRAVTWLEARSWIEGAMGVNATGVAEPLLAAMDRLKWLCPSTESLARLAEPSPAADPFDPAVQLLLLRYPRRADALQFALCCLHEYERQADPPYPDPARPACALALRASRTLARLAGELATALPENHPSQATTAQIASLLAGLTPLGWLVVCAVQPDLADRCVQPRAGDPILQQRLTWGIDHVAIARRVARRWQLPEWVAVPLAYPTLPTPTLMRLAGTVPDEWPAALGLARLAVALLSESFAPLGLPLAQPLADLLPICDRDGAEALHLARRVGDELATAAATPATAPQSNPLLLPLLRAALDREQQTGGQVLARVERELDTLVEWYGQQQARAAERLHEEKLAALAEFAAGAGHEINNPLAVISVNAQYLSQRETDPQRQKALATIIRQTRRIHEVLTGLMQFARPTPPRLTVEDLRGVVESVVNDCRGELASPSGDESGVLLTCELPEKPVLVPVDRQQIAQALAALIRNAVEAVGKSGWVRVGMEPRGHEVVVAVQDCGPGLTAHQRRHLFDPFYSGRQAGRGRGLGLPIAWRIAKEHGGDLIYQAQPGQPTCFALVLPTSATTSQPERRSA